MQEVNKAAKQTARDMEEVSGVFSRMDNRAGGSAAKGSSSALSQLAKAGLFNQVGQALSGAGSALISSAFGSEVGGAVNSVFSGVASGAAMGSVLGPAGTAIGAAVGALTGAINAATENFAKRDESFKGVVQERYETASNQQTSDITAGSSIAAGRETNQISFATLFGDEKVAEGYLSNLVNMANRTPFLYDDLTAMSKTLATYGYKDNEILGKLETIGDTGAALGMGTSDMSMVATALGRMKSSGKTTLEYLNILNDRGVNGVGMLADYYGKSQGDIYDMISKGKIDGKEASEAIFDALAAKFSGSMARQSETFAGRQSTLEGMNQEMQNAYGEGYNTTRKMGMEAQIDFLGGKGGSAIMEGNKYVGQWKASLENLEEEMGRDAMNAVMGRGVSDNFRDEEGALKDSGKRLQDLAAEYRKYITEAEAGNAEAGAEIGRILSEAQVIAQNEYMASDGFQIQLEANKKLADDIRKDTALQDDYWNAGYEMGKQFSKGIAGAIRDTGSEVFAPASTYLTGGNATGGTGSAYAAASQIDGTHATGLSRVPFDNYLALLHEGERVLTAQEARQADRGGAGGEIVVNISGNQFSVRSDSDVDEIAQALAKQIALARQAGTL